MTVDQFTRKSNASEDLKGIYVAKKEDLENRSLGKEEALRPRTHTKEVERGSKDESRLREVVSVSGHKAMFLGILSGGAAVPKMEFIEYVMDVVLDGCYLDH